MKRNVLLAAAPLMILPFLLAADTVLNAPDGGMTLVLLGGALVGLEGLRCKFRA
jgi:hypothetical protein